MEVGLLSGWAALVPIDGLLSGHLISGRASGRPDVPGGGPGTKMSLGRAGTKHY
jgi:hypothetical protein